MIRPDRELLERAKGAGVGAYAPYSGFRVGAAVRANGRIYVGCNIENASYGLTVCAERVALFAAVADGARRIDALALACIDAGPLVGQESLMPCGACRQVMAEFGAGDLAVHVQGAGSFALSELLPHPFVFPKK